MGYCTISDMRDAKLHVGDVGDAELQRLIDKATTAIDEICHWHFDHRQSETRSISGNGLRVLHLPVHATQITEVRRIYRGGSPSSEVVDPELFYHHGSSTPGQDDRCNPKLELYDGVWTKGVRNFEVDGDWGFVESDGNGGYRVPLAIQDACMQLVAHNAPAGDEQAKADKRAASDDMRSHMVRGRTVTYAGPTTSFTAAGIADVDRILAKYQRPGYVGAL